MTNKLTKEEILNFPNTPYGRQIGKELSSKVISELLEYKNLEEEIGCPLEVVLRAVKQRRIWNGYTWLLNMRLNFINDVWCLSNGVYSVETSGYQKTWWLKEDKVE